MRELGRWAAIRLHERIAGRTFDVHPQVLPTRLVERGSGELAPRDAGP